VQLAERGLLLALLWGTGIGILISAVGGAFMAWRALRPVDKITQTAREILSTDNLDQRVPISSKPNDEVGRLAHAFNDMLERLSKLFFVQQRLVADVSHELRTPLTVLRGNVDLLRAMGCADMESLDAMTRETDRMTRMVGNILLLSQADAGVLPMQMQVMEMAPLIQDVVRSANVLAGDRVQIASNICTDALVKGDHDRLKQVFLNLIENAIKHTPTGGLVSIDCDSPDAAAGIPKQINIAVSDTGTGIPEADLPHVFERFYRADKSRSREHGGAGLGLSIAMSIVQTHGGHMSVRSKMGEGTTFEVHLPAYQPSLTAA
jgi:signal transduction histidine kinase